MDDNPEGVVLVGSCDNSQRVVGPHHQPGPTTAEDAERTLSELLLELLE